MKILKGATLIDGTGGPPLSNSMLTIDGNLIKDVGTTRDLKDFGDAEIFDLSGMILLPGLIDCHDHLGSSGYSLMDRWGLDAPASLRHIRITQTLREILEMGYTAVRDAGGLDQGFKQAVDEGLISGPRLQLSVSIISPTGGLADTRSPSGHCCPPPVDLNLPSGMVDGPDAVRAKVREMVRMGAEVIKCSTTGGASSRPGHGPFDREFTREEVQALVDEAHNQGCRVMCHALGGPGLRLAVEIGVDSIEHGTHLDMEPDLISVMADKGIFYVPTLLVYDYHRKSVMDHVRQRAMEIQMHHVESVRRAVEAGVRVVAGTDAGGMGHPRNAGELQCMVEDIGMTPMQALRAGTGMAAQCLGWEKEIGTLEKGKLADLIAVNKDPLRDIGILLEETCIQLVLKDGRVVVDRRTRIS